MNNPFIQKAPKIIVGIDKRISNCALVSVVPDPSGGDSVVVGAYYENRCASYFPKTELTELIKVLTEVRDAM